MVFRNMVAKDAFVFVKGSMRPFPSVDLTTVSD